jgi:D-serine deaminase-like pyridoxal phosphate-dependent protein
MSDSLGDQSLQRELGPRLHELRTPCLVCDERRARANCERASHHAVQSGTVIRPHAKAHKCSNLLRMQLSWPGTHGVTCATVEEALTLAQLGFDDLLVANEVVSRSGCDALAATARQAVVTVAVDGVDGIACAAAAAAQSDREIGVLLDFDVGCGRCGCSPRSSGHLALARAIDEAAGLRLYGVMGYTGRANYTPDRAERQQVATSVRELLTDVLGSLRSAGFAARVVSGGSTGTFDLDQGLTELQLGSYVLMEGRYATVGLPFEVALYCAATVISLPREGVAVLDCGWKAISGERGLPQMQGGLDAVSISDEHLVCAVRAERRLRVGDVVLVVPPHLDPTVNLHSSLIMWDGSDLAEWPVDLRREGPRLTEAQRVIADDELRG